MLCTTFLAAAGSALGLTFGAASNGLGVGVGNSIQSCGLLLAFVTGLKAATFSTAVLPITERRDRAFLYGIISAGVLTAGLAFYGFQMTKSEPINNVSSQLSAPLPAFPSESREPV